MNVSPLGGMTYARFFPSDWRTGCMVLNLEEEGLYIRFCAYMYDTGSAPPDNEQITSHLLNVQIQKYRKVMNSLIAKGKIIRAQGLLINERVQQEIDKYRIEHASRSEAAKKREIDRKVHLQREIEKALAERAAAAIPPHQPPGQPPHQPPPGSPGGGGVVPPDVPHGVSNEKPNGINGANTTTVADDYHGSGTNPEARIQKLNKKETIASQESDAAPALAGLNGSAEPMLKDILGWMIGGDEGSARNWLAKFTAINGQDIVRESYIKLSTDLLSGTIIAKPLQAWGNIATRMRKEPRARPGVGDSSASATRKEKYSKMVQDAFDEQEKSKRRHHP